MKQTHRGESVQDVRVLLYIHWLFITLKGKRLTEIVHFYSDFRTLTCLGGISLHHVKITVNILCDKLTDFMRDAL